MKSYIFTLLALLVSLLGLAKALPQTPPTINGDITCKTNSNSPSESDLRSLGNLSPFPDGRGFCLTLGAMCPGTFNNLCADSGRVETVRLAARGTVVVEAVGTKKNMEILCGEVDNGIGLLRGRCTENGKVAGSIAYRGANGKGYVTINVRKAS